MICPDCMNHKRTEPRHNDCKNLFYVVDEVGQKKIYGQCVCYSDEHLKGWGSYAEFLITKTT